MACLFTKGTGLGLRLCTYHIAAQFCSLDPYLSDEMTNLNRYGYGHSPVQTKLNILKSLCEKQFDFNLKFKETVGGSPQVHGHSYSWVM
jgi:hypothetical protein